MRPFNQPKKNRRTDLSQKIVDHMINLDPEGEEYQNALKILERLDAMEAPRRAKPISLDTIVMTAGNLILAGGVIMYEKRDVWTSKVPLNFLGGKNR